MNNGTMLYTPKYHIPIGRPVRTEGGEYGLCIKKSKGHETETVTIGALLSMLVSMADKLYQEENNQKAESPSEGLAA